MEFGGRYGKLGPFIEDALRLWSRPALQLGFYTPGNVWAAIFAEDFVCTYCVEVFGVYEEAVHVKKACADWGEAGGVRHGGF